MRRRQLERICRHCPSPQSCKTVERRYASPSAGTSSKKSPPTKSHLFATPLSRKVLSAPCSALGRSKHVQRMLVYRFVMAAHIDPWAPPTSTNLVTCEKSYAARRPAVRAALILDIARNSMFPYPGLADK